MTTPFVRVVVLDMQPIDPPVGGGRLRLLGLYHDLGPGLDATYVGTYDWSGPGFRDHRLAPRLREIDVPLSVEHFAAAERLRAEAGGRVVIDSAFAEQAHLSPDFVEAARRQVRESDVVVFSHPWVHPLVADVIEPSRQLVVYDAHNVEGLLRTRLLDDGGAGTRVARDVVRQEYALCHAADLVLACSQEDRLLFERLYGVPPRKVRVVPNGVFASRIRPAGATDRRQARVSLGVPGERPVALFLGSAYAPNLEAARLIARELVPRFPEVLFVVAGGVGDELGPGPWEGASNLLVTGQVSEEDKLRWLAAADIALNPMLSGSGTNIKMFDFMAAGLPILTTPTGARGIDLGSDPLFELAEPGGLAHGLTRLLADPAHRCHLAERARAFVERFFAWERIAPQLGRLLGRHLAAKRRGKRPFFSVVVPSFERHDRLTRLLEHLAAQVERDFEVIVVDQSAAPWPERGRDFGVTLDYVHSDVRGAVPARNLGAFLACGEVIAFTDDDCEPSPGWLAAARPLLRDPEVVGVEGLIRCAPVNDPNWRTVTNRGWVGLGFMTANLFLRLDAFNRLNGFDLAFDDPHFREDTDLGWRALELGRIPFSENAWVYHPPQPRAVERESSAARDRFFVKDALLYRKHPDRFVELVRREGHIYSNENYLGYLLEGLKRYRVEPRQDLLALIPWEKRPARGRS
jgi:glycosyltransferase involved in cell wall biosynthesis